ncbi:MAG: hypothetical protein LBE33_06295 [Zoogloeaceae bacterium]|jgi:hypothetical protein|nr:hypothetical protein [Zoogloeaceae bacterium]
MKQLIIILCIIGGAIFLFQRQHSNVISNPVYAEVHATLDVGDRHLEGVIFTEVVDETDCKKYSDAMVENLQEAQTSIPTKWVMKSLECKSELPPRFAKFFNNEPTFVTYLSIARNNWRERETRLLFWGVSVDESDMICNQIRDGIFRKHNIRKDALTCVRAMR